MTIKKLLAASALASMSLPASAATITFTEIMLSNLTTVTNQYAAYGINSTGHYYYVDGRDTFDTRGLSSLNQEFLDFDAPVNNVSLDYWVIQGTLTITALDSSNNVLQSLSWTGNEILGSDAFSVNGIKRLRFDHNNPGGYYGLSTLRFDSNGAVPEPATWAMLVLAFGVVGGAMRTRKAVLSYS